MKINLKLCLVFMISVFVHYNTISQNQQKQKPLPVVVYEGNVNNPLTSEELSKIQAVYGDRTDESVLNHSQRLKDIKNILRNRVVIVDAGDKDLSGFPKLSQVELFNDFVPTLTRDFTFSPESFNPLKYKFNFYSRNSAIYWVDNTSYYIEIKSQHQ